MSKRQQAIWIFLGTSLLILVGLLYWGIGPTLACSFPSKETPQAGTSVYRIESGGRRRCYILYLPPDYESGSPLPLVLSLHGFSSNPHGQRAFSQWDQVAKYAHVAIVYPQGTGFPQHWNADPEFGISGDSDVEFIQALINQLTDQLPLDHNRIYVTGFSNGGAMTIRLACELGGQIAAIGTVAAPVSPTLLACQFERPVPVIAFHGTQDPIVPYTGRSTVNGQNLRPGESHTPNPDLNAASEWITLLATKNGCAPDPRPLTPQGEVTGIAYEDCVDNASVLFYIITGGGHTWPGGRKIPFVGKTTDDIRASEIMWTFFERHPLP